MPLVVRPSRDHPIYVEWKKWMDICDTCFSSDRLEAIRSIERIAQFFYKDGYIVGSMIMMRDEDQMEAERSPTDPTPSKGDEK